MKFLYYWNRALAVAALIGFAVMATSSIGAPSSCKPVEWADAWIAALVTLSFVFIGFMAGRESKETA